MREEGGGGLEEPGMEGTGRVVAGRVKRLVVEDEARASRLGRNLDVPGAVIVFAGFEDDTGVECSGGRSLIGAGSRCIALVLGCTVVRMVGVVMVMGDIDSN